MKVEVNLQGLKNLAVAAKRNGTQDEFIDLVLQWAEAADDEIQSLKYYLEKIKEPKK
jgi:hypothetical protein